jgi:hypothetical protein
MELQHSDRRGFIEEISAINRKLREDAATGTVADHAWSLI